jgi:hypothetical protein
MQVQENEAGGMSVILSKGEDLNEIPASHRACLTQKVRSAFLDPTTYCREIAERCRFPNMAKWLVTVTDVPPSQWRLRLDEGQMFGLGFQAGFYFRSTNVQSATICPRTATIVSFPPELEAFSHYFSLVDVVHWDAFGCSGGLFGNAKLCGLSHYGLKSKSKSFPAKQTFVWGSSACGDALLCTEGGLAGFLSHESGKVQALARSKRPSPGCLANSCRIEHPSLTMVDLPKFPPCETPSL